MTPQRQIPEGRKVIYYLGMALIVIGLALFISSIFIGPMFHTTPSSGLVIRDSNGKVIPPPPGFPLDSMPAQAQSPSDFASDSHNQMIQCLFAMLITLAGSVMMSIGKRGLAGAGVILDPETARRDLEPWSRMGGGMIKDAMDEAGIKVGGEPANKDLSLDERLRRLQKLRQDELVSDQEYESAKKQILESA